MEDAYIGEVRLFAGKNAPRGWMFCQGQMLQIQHYTSFFSVMSNQFGGDGKSTFALPDLRGRVPVGSGAGPGLTPRTTGEMGGAETVVLSQGNLPAHQHSVVASNQQATLGFPSVLASPAALARGGTQNCYSNTLDGALPPTLPVGGGQAHDNMSPWCAMNYIICLEGVYPLPD